MSDDNTNNGNIQKGRDDGETNVTKFLCKSVASDTNKASSKQ